MTGRISLSEPAAAQPWELGFQSCAFQGRQWVECGTDCPALVYEVVISQTLDDFGWFGFWMILMVFSNLSNSVNPRRVWVGWFRGRMVQSVWWLLGQKKNPYFINSGIYKFKECLWAQHALYALRYLYTYIHTIFITEGSEGPPFPLEQDPCGDAG